MSKKNKVKKKHLLIEYEMAQVSAEHHDNIVWQIISVIWGGSLILLGFVIDSLNNPQLKIPIIGVGVLGILLTLFTWYHGWILTKVKRQKYDRCKQIERELGFKQHVKLDYPGRRGFRFFIIIMVCFLVIWFSIIVISIIGL